MNGTGRGADTTHIFLLGAMVPVVGSVIIHQYLADWGDLANIPFHSEIEALGAFAALSLAILILMLERDREGSGHYFWIACGLIAMGILDSFHAAVPPGPAFVWSRSLSTLIGGLFFALVCLVARESKRPAPALPVLVVAGAILVGGLVIANPELLPPAVVQGEFTPQIKAANIVGGLFFLAAAVPFIRRYRVSGSNDDFLFATLCLLLASSGLLFQISQLWDADWWFWHLLRVAAFFVAILIVFQWFNLGEALKRMVRQITEGIVVIASSASEIMASSTQVAAGAAETVAAVSETTTTVEEVKQTAQVASQKARDVSESAQRSAQVAREGRKAVVEFSEGMGRIQEQMTAIAQSIIRLAEQGQAIGDIISTVNDLAEQSKLLAVNAAIEAAKAGEQGKGFGVVAQEIKGLADQSKEATARVRAILNDIQQATNVAVLATEQGGKAVDNGVLQSAEAGEAIRLMGECIDQSAQAAIQIAASSQQQLTGMDQVAMAMENIRQASEQNVVGVKQVEATVQGLHDLGQELKRMVNQYGEISHG